MKDKFLLATFVGMLMALCAIAIPAQNSRLAGVTGDQYVISAKAGGVNFVSGTVTVNRKDGTSGYLLNRDELQIGDRVTTSADGKAEILLNPGSYMRIGGNTSFEFVTTDLEDLEVSLKSGSAVFEVIAANEFRVSVRMPKSSVSLTHSGVFRVDVLADGTSKLSVFKGKASIGPAGKTEVASGRTATLVPGGISVTKFDRDTKDELDIWSKERGKDLMKVNAQLERKALQNSLLNSFTASRWNMYNSFGLWIFDPMRRMSCFLPFGYDWSSPYGWYYGFDIWSLRLPWYVFQPRYYPPNTGGGSSGGTTTGGTTGGGGNATPRNPRNPSGIVSQGDRRPVPPFVRLQGTQNAGGGSIVNSPRGRDTSSPIYTPSKQVDQPVYIPPASPPPAMPRTKVDHP